MKPAKLTLLVIAAFLAVSRLQALSFGIANSFKDKALPELRLIISQDQVADVPFVLHLQVRGPIVNAVVAHRRIPLKRLAGIFFSGDPEAKVIAAAYTVSEVQFIWRPKVTAGRITALITSPCLQGALPPDQQVVGWKD
jgi:hypothetical protein